MSKEAQEVPGTAVRLDVAPGRDGEMIQLSLAAVEVLACLCMPINAEDPGPKARLIGEDVCDLPIYGFNAAREFRGWTGKEIVKAAIAELRIFFARKEIITQRYAFVVGHDRTREAQKAGETLGYSLSTRAFIWTRSFVGALTPEG